MTNANYKVLAQYFYIIKMTLQQCFVNLKWITTSHQYWIS